MTGESTRVSGRDRPRAATPPRAWWLVGLLSATATASYLCRVNLSVVGVLVMREFGLTQVQMGRIFSAFLLTYALCQVPAGVLADRFGARRVLMAAAWCWAAVSALQASAGTSLLPAWPGAIAVLMAGRLLLGVAEAPTFTAAAQGISRWMEPAAHARANGLVIAAVGLGSAIAPPLLAWSMLRLGWRGALAVSAIPAIGVAVAWLFVRPGAASPRPVVGPADARGASGAAHGDVQAAAPGRRLGRPFVLLTLSYSLQGYVGYIFVFWFYLYLVQVRHFDLLRGAFLGSLPWLLTIVAVPLGGAVADRLARRRPTTGAAATAWRRRIVPMTGLIGAGGFIAAGAYTADPWIAALALAGATGLVMSVEGPFWATMTRLSAGRAGLGGGLMNMGCNIGGLVSPAITPVLAGWMGWERALLVAAVLSVAGGLLWLGIGTDEPEEPFDGASAAA